jgi:polyisoprenoid-binding protein YceI
MKLILLFTCTLVSLVAQDKPIDVQRSTLTIHVGKAGLLSAAGHEHWINAPISSGKYSEADPPRIEFSVSAAKMEVKPDPKVDAKTQADIQKDMQEMTLESAKYPEIVFRSSRVVKSGDAQWKAEGALTLHGVTKTVRADVKKTGDAYTGRTTIKQTDFGIKPVTVGGGLVKVKDELEIEFQIR